MHTQIPSLAEARIESELEEVARVRRKKRSCGAGW